MQTDRYPARQRNVAEKLTRVYVDRQRQTKIRQIETRTDRDRNIYRPIELFTETKVQTD